MVKHFSDSTGNANLTVYNVFEGVNIIFNSIHMDRVDLGCDISGNIIEIHHCVEGTLEHICGNDLVYLMPGDLSIARRQKKDDICFFPLRHYHGITITIDEDIVSEDFLCLLRDTDVNPSALADTLLGTDNCYVIRRQDYIEHIFSELYSVPEEHKKGYFRIKIAELLFVLSWKETSKIKKKPSVSKSRAELAKNVAAYLCENTNRKVTCEELSEHFHMSSSNIRSSFKAVYGIPVSSYIRTYKIQCASSLLIKTNKPITEIAGECGYDTPGKFSAAFKEIMGESPHDFRNNHLEFTT